MANEYNHKQVESKWRKKWNESKSQKAKDFDQKPKYYALVEFPYPSGEGLHLGHAFTNVILDISARKKRMDGFNVLYPMGWDAFGLPTENYAIKTGRQPSLVTKKNTDNFRNQMKKLALAYNWGREINTTDPDYYKWTQWIFLKFFGKGLAYKAEAPVGWCPSCKIILANEEVVDSKCERCGTTAEHKLQKQWMLKITAYADRLADELDLVDYPESAKTAQRNWIGRTEGVTVSFELENDEHSLKKIDVFTTRVDTLYGATFMVIAPEHQLAINSAKTNKELAEYIKKALSKSERERKELVKTKTGVDTRVKVVNPATGDKIPVWVSDFVLSSYGTGAVMGVPAHDQRDMGFALKFNLPVKQVFEPGFESGDFNGGDDLTEHAGRKIKQEIENVKKQIKKGKAYEGMIGKIINSGNWSGSRMPESRKQIIKDVEKKGWGKASTTYHLRDWVFSRQHYWGEPIPIIDCPKCGLVPVPEDQLPLELPKVKNYQPTDTGESPLANIDEWVNTTCPKCGGKAKRETDTMPNWAGSSWYFLRYCDPKNDKTIAEYEKLDYWMPVDLYLGGAEHTTLHLLYSRFWHKFLNDLDLVPGKEPYMARRQHGIILAEDGTKMSKSKGNVVNPDDMVEKYGADTLRIYLAFMGPYDQTMPWSTSGIEGAKRFINRIWNIFQRKDKFSENSSELLEKSLNNTIKKVGNDIDNLKHNTAVATLMTFLNNWEFPNEVLSKQDAKKFLIILAPFAPFLSEELWGDLGHEGASVHQQQWPKAKKIKKDYLDIAVMIDGKQRSVIRVKNSKDTSSKDWIEKKARKDEKVSKHLKDEKVARVIYVKGKVINFVTK